MFGRLVWPPRGDRGFGYDPDLRSRRRRHHIRRNGAPARSTPSATAPTPSGNCSRPASAADETDISRSRAGFRALYPLAVLPVEMPLLRFQQPCARGGGSRPLARGVAAGARASWRGTERPAPHQHLLRRRHAVADAARDRGRRHRAGAQASGRRIPKSKSRWKPIRTRPKRSASPPSAMPASTGCRSACSRCARRLQFLGRQHSAGEARRRSSWPAAISTASPSISSMPGRGRPLPPGARSCGKRWRSPAIISRSIS